MSAWAISFSSAFANGGTAALGFWGCVLLIPWFTFLYTGLFVTGHDAMHGSVSPQYPKLNKALGTLALLLYGLIPYDKLCSAHDHHHQFPASHRDPDFHNGRDKHPVLWYLRFMGSYWTWRQTIGLIIIYNGLHRLLGVPESNLLVFWAIPSLLSSIQLFYFGTYLVHRQLPDTYDTPLCANSNYWPEVISLITCYHFGYHREHHAFPKVPWWMLPQIVSDVSKGQYSKVYVHQRWQCARED
ncbi:MAG: fatty acid desaturase [Cyanobacteria bacterium J06627_28]